jgi:hypothetical protein
MTASGTATGREGEDALAAARRTTDRRPRRSVTRLRIPPRRRTLAVALATVAVVLGSVTANALPADAATPPVPGNIVSGSYLISDAEFFASRSMTATSVQSFLNARVATCKAKSGDPTCLKSFTADLPAKAADEFCGPLAKKTKARAADIIKAVATACGINPKVILVMLQKEQGLVTSTAPSAWNYRAAMGQSCPDTAPCSAAAAGFVNQVYLGARQMQIYTQRPGSFTYQAGVTNTIKWHPDAACGTSRVLIANQATANLYNYTPYRPNISALAAGYGSGDPCSAYGNRNFYNYYVDWFAKDAKTTTGAPATVSACRKPVAAEIVSEVGVAKIKASATTVRTAPSTSCATGRVSAAKGTTYNVTGRYAGWLRLKTVRGQVLWTFATNATFTAGRLLTPAPVPMPMPMPQPAPAPTGGPQPLPPAPAP